MEKPPYPTQEPIYPRQVPPLQTTEPLQNPPPYDNNFGQPLNPTALQAVTITAHPVANFGPDPQPLSCPHCHAQIISKVEVNPSTKTHLIALLLCCCVCWPCAWIPYCVDSCQNKNHSCPNCGAYLGTYSS